ncbi:MAG: hypothetical protein GY852_09095 [bacterium]|nr:hypothetical protein [bacterium]
MALNVRNQAPLSAHPRALWKKPDSEKSFGKKAARAIAIASTAVFFALGAASCYSMGDIKGKGAPEKEPVQDAGIPTEIGILPSVCDSEEILPEQDILLEKDHAALLAPNAISISFREYSPESEIAQVSVGDVWKLPFPNDWESKHFLEGINSSTVIKELDGDEHTVTFCGAEELPGQDGETITIGRFVTDSKFLDCDDCAKVWCGSESTEEVPSGSFTQQVLTNQKLSGWIQEEGEITDCPEVKTRITTQKSEFDPGLETQENLPSEGPKINFLDFDECTILSVNVLEGIVLLDTPKGAQELVLGGTAVCADGTEYKVTELETDGINIYGWTLSLSAIIA